MLLTLKNRGHRVRWLKVDLCLTALSKSQIFADSMLQMRYHRLEIIFRSIMPIKWCLDVVTRGINAFGNLGLLEGFLAMSLGKLRILRRELMGTIGEAANV